MSVTARRFTSGAAAATVLLLPVVASLAATPLSEVRVSPDTTVTLSGTTADDESVVRDDLAGSVTSLAIGSIPAETDLDAYNVRPNGVQLLSFDTTVVLPGGITARPGDVVRYDGAGYAIEFNAAAAGIGPGVNLDAVAVYGSSLLLSFDTAFDIGGLHVEPADLVLFDGATFTSFFSASPAGIAPGLNLDAADYLPCNGHLLLSFDGSGTIGGVAFDDEDVLEFDRASTWEMAYDGSAHDPHWGPADLDAVHAVVNLGAGTPAVFSQTVSADADKTTFRWPTGLAYRAVRGTFTTSTSIGAYAVQTITIATSNVVVEPSTPAAGTGFWILVKPGGCTPTSWQSTLGSEPGRDSAIP
jgi:hypothetical protein